MSLRKLFNRLKKSEAGNILVMVISSSVALIAVSGLAVDYGFAVLQETKLQNAANLAALAGIQELPYTASAKATMQEYLASNYEYTSECKVDMDSTTDSCWLIVAHPVPTRFMRIFGRDELVINARAKAELQNVEGFSGGIGVEPFILIGPNYNENPDDDLKAENHGKPYILKYGADNIMIADWYFGRQIISPSNPVHTEGGVFNNGWRSVLSLDPGSTSPYDTSNASSDYLTNFVEGWKGEIKIGDILASNPGVMTSGTKKGRENRLKDFLSYSWDSFDANVEPYNKRLILVPIVSLGYYNSTGQWVKSSVQDVANGNYDWKFSQVDGFGAFYLLTESEMLALPGAEPLDGKWIAGRYIHGLNIGGEIFSSGSSSGPDFGLKQGRLVPF